MEYTKSLREDVPHLRRLWKGAFGDGEEFLDLFFGSFYRPEETLVGREKGMPVTMLVLAPTGFRGEGEERPLPYVYALCTDPACRGKGAARGLLDYAAALAGGAGVCTVPAEGSLHRFFASAGFREGLATWEGTYSKGELPAPEGEAVPISAEEYGALREKLLEGLPHVTYPPAWLRLQEEVSRMSGAGLYRIEAGGRTGCAAVERLGEKELLAKELLCPGGTLEGGGTLAAKLTGERYCLRTPGEWAGPGGELRAFGMVRGGAPAGRGYLGLAFD